MYYWHRAVGEIDDVLDELAEDDASSVVPHASVAAFRRQLLARLPQLADVIGPEDASADTSTYVCLTLPFSWVPLLTRVEQLAADHGLTGWDPQTGEPVGRPPLTHERAPEAAEAAVSPATSPVTSAAVSPEPPPDGGWTAGRLSGLGLGTRAVARAWSLAELPERVGFGHAVGAFVLGMALRDGAAVDRRQAREAVDSVARHCTDGPPTQEVYVHIDFTMIDVTGVAGTVARGRR